jgi:hypothetical protein
MLQQPVKAGNDAVIALEIEVDDEKNFKQQFELAEKYLTDNPFCLQLNLHKTLTAKQATDLIAFLFFSNYYKPGRLPQIITGGENTALIKPGIEQLQQTAKAQGFATLAITPVSALPAAYLSTEHSTIQATYKSWLQSPAVTTDIIYIRVNKPADIHAIREMLEAEEALFGQQNPGLYALKLQNRELNKQVQQLEQFFQAAQQEISNQVSHNQILRSSSQATALQNYYNNEYEVLPLWFKRLGHVVKALMGKRSFKSLYSDKVKKYRD